MSIIARFANCFTDHRDPELIEHSVDDLIAQRVYGLAQMESLLTDLFIEAHPAPPERIILDFDATDDPIHGDQLGRFFQVLVDQLRSLECDASNRSCRHLV